jgi:hypothetical protein
MTEMASRITSESGVSYYSANYKEDALHFGGERCSHEGSGKHQRRTASQSEGEPVADNPNLKAETQSSLTPPDERKKGGSCQIEGDCSYRDETETAALFGLYEAARKCQHPGVTSYLERVVSRVPLLEVQTVCSFTTDKASNESTFDVFSSSPVRRY